MRVISLAWLVIAAVLGVASFLGGDTAILAGWLFLVWTAPFGILWWFYLYDYALAFMPTIVAQRMGTALVVVTAFLFWFICIPLINKWLNEIWQRRRAKKIAG